MSECYACHNQTQLFKILFQAQLITFNHFAVVANYGIAGVVINWRPIFDRIFSAKGAKAQGAGGSAGLHSHPRMGGIF